MFRAVENDLIAWKNEYHRKPLLIRGARQVGKSYVVEKFGQTHFPHLLKINFELEPRYQACFNSLDPTKIINSLEILSQQDIIAGETLLFLDEIQQCPKALVALRYFKELMPELHVIGAGSFLEFTLNDEHLQQPVGRVQSLYMKPCSFREYLLATGHQRLIDYLGGIRLNETIEPPIHELLLEKCREYFILGGMPEVIDFHITTNKFYGCEKLQATLLEYYKRDFSKYGAKVNVKVLEKIFTKAPRVIAKHFKYVDIDPDIQARDQKPALEALIKAGILYPVYQTSGNGLPFSAEKNEKKFKLLFLDIGLAKHATGLDTETLFSEKLILLNQGALAEQFVGQELLAYAENYQQAELYHWIRDKRGSQAEVDYLINVGPSIYPVEVKSGATGRMKSLQLFLDEKKLSLGIRISQKPFSLNHRVLSIPFYMIYELPRLLKSL